MKASARHIMDEHARSCPSESQWTPKLVKDALVEAFRISNRYGGRVGPRGAKAAWPEYQIEPADYTQQVISGTFKGRPLRLGVTAAQISRTEMILYGWTDQDGVQREAWLRGPLLGYPDYREKLLAWVKAEVSRLPATELCRRRGWAYATMKRHRDAGAEVISDRLNRLKVPVK